MGTSSGTEFNHHEQQQAHAIGLALTLQTSLSLAVASSPEQVGSPLDTQELLPNSDEGHDSATESTSSQEEWREEPSKSDGGISPVAAALTNARIADNEDKDVVGNSISEMESVRSRILSAAQMTLREVARDRVDLVAEKMKGTSEELLEEVKTEMRSILELTRGSYQIYEFLYLQKLVHDRVDLTMPVLLMAHHVQLVILVVIRTGIQAFLHPSIDTPQSRLAEIFLYKRCRNIPCQSALPADECECIICNSCNGFCNFCMCTICKKFDFEVNTCRWVGCGLCSHWAHTYCAIRNGQIATGHMIKNGVGHVEMLFRCQACQSTTELLGWVRDVFQQCAPGWDRDASLRELDYVCEIFSQSEENSKGSKLFRKCVELVETLRSGSNESMLLQELQGNLCKDSKGSKLFSKCAELIERLVSDSKSGSGMVLQAFQDMYDQWSECEALERILNNANEEPIELSYAFLQNITNNFSDEIGNGGFGVVYMGVLQNQKIAVKRLLQTYSFSDKQFEDELMCLRRVKHKNIVRFLGYCSDTQQRPFMYDGQFVLAEDRRRFLCFEYVPNKSLHDYLRDECHAYEWDTRYQLIDGICQGLRYLHDEERISHLDLKPANILLDFDMVPKITDFGLSRHFSGEQSIIITENIRGSRGYIAPEYLSRGEISLKADIFSLGVIIRKLLLGSNDLSNDENRHQSLDIDKVQVTKRCIEIAEFCVDDDPRKRPTIGWIIDKLNEKESIIEAVAPVSFHSRKDSWSSEEQEYASRYLRLQLESTEAQQALPLREDQAAGEPSGQSALQPLLEQRKRHVMERKLVARRALARLGRRVVEPIAEDS